MVPMPILQTGSFTGSPMPTATQAVYTARPAQRLFGILGGTKVSRRVAVPALEGNFGSGRPSAGGSSRWLS